ncbi:GNAT family N-acetyltransferase [Candidatus Bathyarchaeota archaeon]|nr:GNAT family N-acetyltransferase [Candidatus Bathyarchaeota archaeon]
MSQRDYAYHQPETNEDIEQVYELMLIVFKDENVDGIVKRLLDGYTPMTIEHVFAVKQGDRTVASLILIPQTWVMDGVELKVAEMGCVATHPDHRRRGLQGILNERFDQAAREGGYDLCALAGIPYFYRQFGYEYSLDLDHGASIPVDRIPAVASAFTARRFTEGDIPAAAKLLEQSQSLYYVHSPRSIRVWRMQHETGYYHGQPFEAFSLVDGDRLAAYMRLRADIENKTLFLMELGVKNGAVEDALGFVKRLCEERGLEKIVSSLGYLDHFTGRIVALGAETKPIYGWQVKVVDYLGLFRKLAPLLESRLRGTEYEELSETLNLNFRKFTIRVSVEQGRIKKITSVSDCNDMTIGLNPYVFPQLLLGYRGREELEHAYPDFRVRDSHKTLIDTLFPRKPSYIHHVY